jgi:hypothetical protein
VLEDDGGSVDGDGDGSVLLHDKEVVLLPPILLMDE